MIVGNSSATLPMHLCGTRCAVVATTLGLTKKATSLRTVAFGATVLGCFLIDRRPRLLVHGDLGTCIETQRVQSRPGTHGTQTPFNASQGTPLLVEKSLSISPPVFEEPLHFPWLVLVFAVPQVLQHRDERSGDDPPRVRSR